MKGNRYQSANSPYHKFIRQESEAFYQATLLMPEEKHAIAWVLFAFWHGLTPGQFWGTTEAPHRFIGAWKSKIFFNEGYFQQLSTAENAWLDLQQHFDENIKQHILNLLNGLEACSGPIRFPSFRELELLLLSLGGSIAVASTKILFADEIQSGNVDFLEPVYYIGAGLVWWKLLKQTSMHVQEGRLFIPLDDLHAYKCSEEDLLAELKNSPMQELTKFQLQKVSESLKFAKKSAINYPKGLKESLTFISNACLEEIHSALRSGWVLSSKELPGKKVNKTGWFVNGITRLHKKNLV